MSSSIISFEEKLAAVLKLGVLDYDGEQFIFRPRTNEGYHIFHLKKGWIRVNSDCSALVDSLFATLCNTTQKSKITA